jgi:hypothetical protein
VHLLLVLDSQASENAYTSYGVPSSSCIDRTLFLHNLYGQQSQPAYHRQCACTPSMLCCVQIVNTQQWKSLHLLCQHKQQACQGGLDCDLPSRAPGPVPTVEGVKRDRMVKSTTAFDSYDALQGV